MQILVQMIIGHFIVKADELSTIDRPYTVTREVIFWTSGQPFLTGRLCQLILDFENYIPENTEKAFVEQLVQSHFIQDWETQLAAEHLKTIRDSILEYEQRIAILLKLNQILLQGEVAADKNPEERVLLRSGLLTCQSGKLKIANRIYEAVFNQKWVKKELDMVTSSKLIKRVLIGGMATISVSFFAIALTQIPSLFSKYRCNKQLSDSEQAAEIMEACNEVLITQPDNTRALENQGRASLLIWDTDRRKERINLAINDFNKAHELEPENPRFAFEQVYMQEFQDVVLAGEKCRLVGERYQNAIELYEQVNKIDKKDFFILLELSNFLINRDRNYQLAIDLDDKLIETQPNSYESWASKATAQFLNKDYLAAKKSLDKAQQINPDSIEIQYNIASWWARVGNYEKASEGYKQVTQRNPDFYLAWRDGSFAFYMLHGYNRALGAFKKTLDFKAAHNFDPINYSLFKRYLDRARECLLQSREGVSTSCEGENRTSLELVLYNSGIFHNVIIHDSEDQDPFLAVEHDAFYKCL